MRDMKKKMKKYWEDIDVPASDFEKQLNTDRSEFEIRLVNRLCGVKAFEWCKRFVSTVSLNKETCMGIIQTRSKDDLLRIYCCLDFANRTDEATIKRAARAQGISLRNHPSLIVDELMQRDPSLLEDIYIDYFILRRYLRKLQSNSTNNYSLGKMPSKRTMTRILNDFERKRRKSKNRCSSKVWWAKERDADWTYVFRTDQKRKKPVRKLKLNKYEKVAATKVLIIKPDLSEAKVFSASGAKTMQRRVTYIIQRLAHDYKLTCSEFDPVYPRGVIDRFVGDIRTRRIPDFRLCEIYYRASRFSGSPALTLKESGMTGVIDSLSELETLNKLPPEDDCMSMTLQDSSKKFNIDFQGLQEVRIIIGKKGLTPRERDAALNSIHSKLKVIHDEFRSQERTDSLSQR
jgi:hypothetical protein